MQINTDLYNYTIYSDYQQLVPALREYRKKMMQAIGMKPGEGYYRIYTEKRACGARTKYWAVNREFRTTSIADYVAKNPTITVGYETYEVVFRRVSGSLERSNTSAASICIRYASSNDWIRPSSPASPPLRSRCRRFRLCSRSS